MKTVFILDMPVYRLEENRYYEELALHIENTFFPPNSLNREVRIAHDAKNPREKAWEKDRIRLQYGGMWRYNEIIGYIRLYFLGSQIRGEYYADRKKIYRSRKRVLDFITHKLGHELNVSPRGTDQEVFEAVCRYIQLCKKELKKRHIDDSEFMRIGPFIRWRDLYRSGFADAQ